MDADPCFRATIISVVLIVDETGIPLPLHETDAVEEDAVKNKQAHVGILERCFLQERGMERKEGVCQTDPAATTHITSALTL